jgi:hypothetical protein
MISARESWKASWRRHRILVRETVRQLKEIFRDGNPFKLDQEMKWFLSLRRDNVKTPNHTRSANPFSP